MALKNQEPFLKPFLAVFPRVQFGSLLKSARTAATARMPQRLTHDKAGAGGGPVGNVLGALQIQNLKTSTPKPYKPLNLNR